jgi:hypothetical protein
MTPGTGAVRVGWYLDRDYGCTPIPTVG